MEIKIDREKLLNRFLKYVAVDTQSADDSDTFPSTSKQLAFAAMLVEDLKQIGLEEVQLDANGYVTASLAGNIEGPVIGFISHMDTSPDMPGNGVRPQIIPHYGGSDILLHAEMDLWLKPSDFPELLHYVGQTIVCTDGKTLLGADDKAGIAEIVSAMEYLHNHLEIKHGRIRIGFTPDEEIGKGVDKFDVQAFGADFAFTMDGGAVGELEYENFNAAMAKISIFGRNIHPGYAKGKMVNALLLAMELNDMLPVNQRPEYTAGYEGFFHLVKVEGSVEKAMIQYIIRDHDAGQFAEKKKFMEDAVAFINRKYRSGTMVLDMKDQYYNMKEKVVPVFHVVELAKKAMEDAGVVPQVVPIRGGTDGARLSYMGLPCPNIFAGGHNFHGKFEFVPVESMEKAAEVIVRIAALATKAQPLEDQAPVGTNP